MPEGDTVWLTASRLNQALRGRPVSRFELRVPRLALSDLSGATITEVASRGKHILMRFDNGHTLHSHLRMDGSWRIAAATGTGVTDRSGSAASARGGRVSRSRNGGHGFEVRAIVSNVDWRSSGHRVHDLDIARTSAGEPWVAHLGPDILGHDWDPARAVRNLQAQPDRRIAEALLDQRNLAGIGNMYAAELLFVTGINPYDQIGSVPALDRVAAMSYRLLRANRDHPEQSTTGRTERGEQHWVYLRGGQPCRRCGTPIASAPIGVAPQQRTTYWCPRCQPAS